MAFLPPKALSLTGGCYCGSIKYKVEVPALEDRTVVPGALPTPISATETVPTRLPIIDLDHCEKCRRVAGNIIQCWFICPADWVTWSLTPKNAGGGGSESTTTDQQEQQQKTPNYDLPSLDVLAAPTERSPAAVRESTLTHFQASTRATRTFCSCCGTHLTYLSHRDRKGSAVVFDITVGSFDTDSLALIRPDRHGWFDHGTDWIKKLVTDGDGGWLIRHPTGSIETAVER